MAERGPQESHLPKEDVEQAKNVTNTNNAQGEETRAHAGLPWICGQKDVDAAKASAREPDGISKGINLKSIGLSSRFYSDGVSPSHGTKGQKRDQKGGWKGRKQDFTAGKRRSYGAPAYQLSHCTHAPHAPHQPQLPSAWNSSTIQPFVPVASQCPATDSFSVRKGYHQHPSTLVHQHHPSQPPALRYATTRAPAQMAQPAVGKGWNNTRSAAASVQPPPGLGWNDKQQRHALFGARKGAGYHGAGGMTSMAGKAWDTEQQQHARGPIEYHGADGGMGHIPYKAWTFNQEPTHYGNYQHIDDDVYLQHSHLADGHEAGLYNHDSQEWNDYQHTGWSYTNPQHHLTGGWAPTEPHVPHAQHKGWKVTVNTQGKDGYTHKGGKYRHDKGWNEDHARAKGWNENQQWKNREQGRDTNKGRIPHWEHDQDYVNTGPRHPPMPGHGQYTPHRTGSDEGVLAALHEETPAQFPDAGNPMQRISQPPCMQHVDAPTTTPLAASYCGTSTPHNILAPPTEQDTSNGSAIHLPLFIPPQTRVSATSMPDSASLGAASPARTRIAPSQSLLQATDPTAHRTLPIHSKAPISSTTAPKALHKQGMTTHAAPARGSTPFSWMLEQQQQVEQQQQQQLLQPQSPSKAVAVPVPASPAKAQATSPKLLTAFAPKHESIMLPLKKSASGELVPISPVAEASLWKQEDEALAAHIENQSEEWNPWATQPPFVHGQPGEERFRVTADDFASMDSYPHKVNPWDPEVVAPLQQHPVHYWAAPLPSSDSQYTADMPASHMADHPPSLAMAAPPRPPPTFSTSAPEFVSKMPFDCQQQQRHEAARDKTCVDTNIGRPSAIVDPLINRSGESERTDECQQQVQQTEKPSSSELTYHDGIKEFVPSWMAQQQLRENNGHQHHTGQEYNGTTFYSWHHGQQHFSRKPLWPERCDNEVDYANSLVLRIPELNNKLMPNLSEAKPWNALLKSGQRTAGTGEESENDREELQGAASRSDAAAGEEDAEEAVPETSGQALAAVNETPSIDLIRSEYCFMKTRCENMVAEYLKRHEPKEGTCTSNPSAHNLAHGEHAQEKTRLYVSHAASLQLDEHKKYHTHSMSLESAFLVPPDRTKMSEHRMTYSKQRPMHIEADSIPASWQCPNAHDERKKYSKRHK